MIDFKIQNDKLICIYTPYSSLDEMISKLNKEGLIVKNTFHIIANNIIKLDDIAEDSITFVLGKVENDYIKMDKDILAIDFDVYFDKAINITRNYKKYFIAYKNISIMKSIVDIVKSDIYIDRMYRNSNDDTHIPFDVFKTLISIFPNSTELKKYANLRVSQILNEYFDGLDFYKINYEKYLARKESGLDFNENNPAINGIKLDLLKASSFELNQMLTNYSSCSEKVWQSKIKDILCIIFPKYLYAVREVNLGELNGYDKYPDFTMIDSNGYVDIMEIKKPDINQVMRNARERNNYVPQKIFTDTIVQASKYILALNRNTDKSKQNILTKLNNTYPSHNLTIDDIKINNPKGIVLFGRSNNLNKEQLDDFELIKRQYKDIAEIMTYDDLMKRIENLVHSLENQID